MAATPTFTEGSAPRGSTLRGVRSGQRRVLAALAATTLTITAAHAALERAVTGSWQWQILAIDGGTAVLILIVAAIYLRAVARERQRELVEHMLLELLAVPRSIRETAIETTRSISDYGLGAATVVAIVDSDDSSLLRPVAARGYPRNWLDAAPPGRTDQLRERPVLAHSKEAHPWVGAATAPLGSRPWTAWLPIRSDNDTIGLVLIASRRPGALRDPMVRELLSTRLSAAFDHAALYEAAYARERTLEELEARRRDFMAGIAHELRTPLTSIQAFADLLQAGQAEMDEVAQSLVSSLGQGVQRLSSLVNDLIDLGRSGQSRYETASVPVDLSAVVRMAESTLRPALVLRQQSLSMALPEEGPVIVSDPRIVEQVALNLLSNANRHTPLGGQIHISAARFDHRTVRLEVSDTGPGIPEAERERIFEPYYRVRNGHSVPGSGLGLAVARRLLEESGGRIWVTESPSGGARFCVELPAAQP